AAITVRELKPKDIARFRDQRSFTRTYSADSAQWRSDSEARFVVSPLSEIWSRLEASCHRFGQFAAVRNGLRVKPDDRSSVSDTQRRGDVPCVDRLDVLRPYALLTTAKLKETRWLKYGPQLDRQRTSAIFDVPKVLVNSNRNPGSSWRLVAAMAPSGLYFS